MLLDGFLYRLYGDAGHLPGPGLTPLDQIGGRRIQRLRGDRRDAHGYEQTMRWSFRDGHGEPIGRGDAERKKRAERRTKCEAQSLQPAADDQTSFVRDVALYIDRVTIVDGKALDLVIERFQYVERGRCLLRRLLHGQTFGQTFEGEISLQEMIGRLLQHVGAVSHQFGFA